MNQEIVPGPLLQQVNFPQDLRKFPEDWLPEFCKELRSYIIEHCSKWGGHFAASLGTVELTTALHYVFDTPNDLLVWDVGHQAYGHKIITGRRAQFHTNRLYKGISGFPKRSESIYDTFGVGHASTSISAALGMAEALRQKQRFQHVVAIIGDGALTGGMAFEGLNNAGYLKSDLLVILNDNCMSIDPNVGALKEYLTDITTSHTYNRVRDEIWRILGKLSSFGEKARVYAAKLEDAFITYFSKPGMLFESLGFRYFGPIDGHDIYHLVRILRDIKSIRGPRLLHCVTVKGKGFKPAEKDQTKWHAPAFNFDKVTGEAIVVSAPKVSPPKYQDVFGQTIIELAEMDRRIVAVTPAMLSGSGLITMHQKMPERCYDVGIAEQHAVTFSAGLATQGIIPFCNIYSTFMQRAYDQVIHDVAIQDLKVIFCLDRAGLVGADGATHHGAYDIAYMRCIPNLIIAAPRNERELRNLMYTAAQDEVTHPFVIRYPRGNGVLLDWKTPFEKIEIGKGEILQEGENIAILSIGHPANFVTKAIAQLHEYGIFPAHFDMRFVKPLDQELLHYIFTHFQQIITVEDGCIMGGFGSGILEFMADNNYIARVRRLGIPDKIIQHGTPEELHAECGYNVASIVETVLDMLSIPTTFRN
ncbi:MAG: 1-deoxy-D-xylulose-5-phosphate synthase [Bacteroidia bacterium]|nr:1-deoxy-D-xylulose-5-phosphate synthase [Bacteroidia bacterium]MDW8158504.1 1-deoxy-D-xylulose-5-phosphate synthase [Bacteroidia bacterium]